MLFHLERPPFPMDRGARTALASDVDLVINTNASC